MRNIRCNKLGAMFASAAIAFCTSSPLRADQYCGAGQHVGSENDAAGASFHCVPDRAFNVGGANVGGNNPAATALRGAAAGLQAASAIVSLANALAGMVKATDTNSSVEADKEGRAVKARDENRSAIQAMQEGQYFRASILFRMAANDAQAADNFEDFMSNAHNANIALAEEQLRDGYVLEQQGNYGAASDHYMRAIYEAKEGYAGDLVKQIAAYNDRLVAAAGGTRTAKSCGVTPTQSDCANLNGKIVCR